MFYQSRLKPCWPTPHGGTSVGAPEQKESSRLASPPSACGLPTAHRSGSGTRVSNICRATRFGSSVRMSGEKEILSRQPAGEDQSARLGGDHQGTMDLRAGPPAAQRGTRSRSLRRSVVARPPPSCAHDDDCLRLPPASPSRSSTAEKKESTARHLSRLCQPCATPSSNSSFDHRYSDAPIAANGFAAGCSVSNLPM